MKCRFVLLLLVLSFGAIAAAADTSHSAGDKFDRTIDRITAREAENVKAFAKYSPIVETYIQAFRKDTEMRRARVQQRVDGNSGGGQGCRLRPGGLDRAAGKPEGLGAPGRKQLHLPPGAG